jgi:hypothetical protein
MKHTKLYPILFEAEEAGMTIDVGKDVADAVKTALEPVTKDVDQMKKDIQVIQKSSGERKQAPTRSRSTTGAEETAAATTVPKGPGTASTTGTTSTGGGNNKNLEKDVETIKTQVSTLTDMAKKVQSNR